MVTVVGALATPTFWLPKATLVGVTVIVAPAGASVQVDGMNVAGFVPIGATGFAHAHHKLSNAGDGSHRVTADQKVGVSVYGVVNFGSYWYPGGLDLKVVPQ